MNLHEIAMAIFLSRQATSSRYPQAERGATACSRSHRRRPARGSWLVPLVLVLLACPAGARADDLGLRLPRGFQVTTYADETLANDIYAMTLDDQGRPVVTGQGYIKVLHDSKGAGKADRASLFATTGTGGMGLCWDGNDLYFCGDGWFSRYRDHDRDGRADGPPQHILPLRFTEHGGHAMRRGPDGAWYIIGGNDSGIGPQHATAADSPIKQPEAGALLRVTETPEGWRTQIIAHGFRNPYDFDINAAGDFFTYDSDVERDYFLPWYSPTRIYHVGYRGHHGWRVTGFLRSWARKGDYLDTVDVLAPIGRGSPTGVACYRHTQFPEHYRGGVFALDWVFGKVWFLPLEQEGASYRTKPEVFLEPVGTNGFAPNDVAVAPDGSLFVSIGGRGTRGAVYRVSYAGKRQTPEPAGGTAGHGIDAVLDAPQPLDAWSRARWMPAAERLGRAAFLEAIADDSRAGSQRVRAVEVATELFGGLDANTAEKAAGASSAPVRARVAWSLGHRPPANALDLLGKLSNDPDPRVRLAALDGLADLGGQHPDEHARAAGASFGQGDKRVRQAAARLAAALPEPAWRPLWSGANGLSLQAKLTAALAAAWRSPETEQAPAVIDQALEVLGQTDEPALRLQAVRLIMMALGDYHMVDPPLEVFTAYSLQRPLAGHEATVARVLKAVRPILPAGNARLDEESARLLAMLEDDDAASPAKVAAFWTKDSSPTRDMHFLVCFARLRGLRSGELTPRVAEALLALHDKLGGDEERNKQVWGERLGEVVSVLVQKDAALADALLKDPRLVNPAHVAIAAALDPAHRHRAAEQFARAVSQDEEFPWSGPLIELLATLPPERFFPLLRREWERLGLRDAVLLELARVPQEEDRERFLVGLESSQPQVVDACLTALDRLPRDAAPERLVPLLQLLRRLDLEPRERLLRSHLLKLLARQTGQSFVSPSAGEANNPASLRQADRPWFDWFERTYPKLTEALEGTDRAALAEWRALQPQVEWSRGDAARGEAVFRLRACQTCHTGTTRIGPDLAGVTSRFSRDDLFRAIVAPGREVAPPYRTTVIATKDGAIYSGIAVFESADGVILQTGATTTLRLANADMAERHPGRGSLMPDGLLKGLSAADVADLYAYLQTLKPATRAAGAR